MTADLIKQLEAAKGPDRELDLAIHIYLFPTGDVSKICKNHLQEFVQNEKYAWRILDHSITFDKYSRHCIHIADGEFPLPPYTGSIDAAQTIAADHIFVFATKMGDKYQVRLKTKTSSFEHLGFARTLELAFCIAALKTWEGNNADNDKL